MANLTRTSEFSESPPPESPGKTVRVESRKFDGRLHRSWRVRLLARAGPLLLVEGIFEEEVRHTLLGTLKAGTVSTEYFWTDRWYSVFRFREPSGELRNHYCNVNLPAAFDGETLSFVDLDIDVLVAPNFSYTILDEDEFCANAARFGYPPEVRRQAHAALAELIHLIQRREFPFDR